MKNVFLSDYISNKYINIILNYNYAGIHGIAETIGWQIELFRLNQNSLVEAISFNEIFNNDLFIDISNNILKEINFPIKINDDLEKIKKVFGNETSKDSIFYEEYKVNVIRYNYYIAKDYFITFSVSNNKLIGLELIYNKDIINNILPYRCSKNKL